MNEVPSQEELKIKTSNSGIILNAGEVEDMTSIPRQEFADNAIKALRMAHVFLEQYALYFENKHSVRQKTFGYLPKPEYLRRLRAVRDMCKYASNRYASYLSQMELKGAQQ